MIIIAIGSNQPHPEIGSPLDVCKAAADALSDAGCRILQASRWYRSAPVPVSDQPDFINGVVSVRTELSAARLLALLHHIETGFGRVRTVPNAARILDLDLISYNDAVSGPEAPVLPHPRMETRAFVLYPLRDVAPDWRHPVSGRTVEELANAVPKSQTCVPVDP